MVGEGKDEGGWELENFHYSKLLTVTHPSLGEALQGPSGGTDQMHTAL